MASLNEQVKSDSADPGSLVKKLPAAEKQARLERQQARLSGLKMIGELAPSHQLLDLVNSILESGAIIWVAPSRCSKRDDEIHANIKPSSATVQCRELNLEASTGTSDNNGRRWHGTQALLGVSTPWTGF